VRKRDRLTVAEKEKLAEKERLAEIEAKRAADERKRQSVKVIFLNLLNARTRIKNKSFIDG